MSSQLWIAPVGTPIDSDTPWSKVGYLSDDGIEIKTETTESLGDWGEPIRTDNQRAITFTVTMASRKVWSKLVFGIYRGPGGKPLIHKGKKP